MNVLQVSYTDEVGGIYNGFSLVKNIKSLDIFVKMFVRNKTSNDERVFSSGHFAVENKGLSYLDKKYAFANVCSIDGLFLAHSEEFKKADIVHYHIFHYQFISLLDCAYLFEQKKTIITIHDPWIFTGNCGYPLSCGKWKIGCGGCERLKETNAAFFLQFDKTSFLWKLKRKIFDRPQINYIVASEFSQEIMEKSGFINRNITHIPFGLETDFYKGINKEKAKMKYNIDSKHFVIGFRSTSNVYKGCKYIFKALELLGKDSVCLLTVGEEKLPQNLLKKFTHISLGHVRNRKSMIDFFDALDVFLMPSLAESFGLMAIEAMLSKTPVICFKNTALEKTINAPYCGIAIERESSEELAKEIKNLIKNRNLLEQRAERGQNYVMKNHKIDDYIKRHVDLYKKVYGEQNE